MAEQTKRVPGTRRALICGGLATAVAALCIWFLMPATTYASGGGHSRPPGGGGIGFGIRFNINLTPGKKPPKPKDPFDDDFFDQEPVAAPTAAPPKPKPKPVAQRSNHPEENGSEAARVYLLEAAMGFDRTLAEDVWNEPRKTLSEYEKELQAAKRSKDTDKQAEAATDVGHVYYLLGRFDKAEKSYGQALKINEKAGNEEKAAAAENRLGAVYAASGQLMDAQVRYDSALKRFSAVNDERGKGLVFNNMAIMAKNRGIVSNAVEEFGRSLNTLAKPDKDRMHTLINLARTYHVWGEYVRAIDALDEAVKIAESLDDKAVRVDVLVRRAGVLRNDAKYNEALDNLEQALILTEKNSASYYRINYLIGSIYLDMGEINRAESYIEAGKYNAGLGRLHLLKSDYKKALEHFANLEKTAKKFDRPADLFIAFVGQGAAYEGMNNLSRAEKEYSRAMDQVETIRESLLLSERTRFFAVPIGGFMPTAGAKGFLRVRLKRNQPDRTVYAGETVKTREFADIVGQRADLRKLGVPKEILKNEELLWSNAAALAKARDLIPRNSDRSRFDEISRQLKQAEREIGRFKSEVAKKYPAYAAVRFPTPVRLREAAIDPDEQIVLLDLLGDGVGIRLIKDKKIRFAAFESWDNTELEREIEAFRKPFEEAGLREFDDERARNLYRKLFSDALKKVKPGTPLTIVPDGSLGLVPFEALVVRGSVTWKDSQAGPYPDGLLYLGDVHPLSYRRSLTAVTLSRTLPRQKAKGAKMLVVADPVFARDDSRVSAEAEQTDEGKGAYFVQLMESARENGEMGFKFNRLAATSQLAESLKNLYGGSCEIKLGPEAKKTVLLDELGPQMNEYRWIVLATHAFAGFNMPGIMEPFLALTMVPEGTDGFLKVSDVLRLNMAADIVALTACNTGYGQYRAGEGVMSLGRAFQCSGARCSLVSLWSVSEDASVKLMENFFDKLKSGETGVKAWQTARNDLRAAGYRHPFYWAPFILVGETR